MTLHGAVAALLQAGQQPGDSQTVYNVDDLKQDTPFVLPQLVAWVKVSMHRWLRALAGWCTW